MKNLFFHDSALHWASDKGEVSMVKLLINAGANVNKLASFDTHSNVTPLHLASQDGHTNVVVELITAKVHNSEFFSRNHQFATNLSGVLA